MPGMWYAGAKTGTNQGPEQVTRPVASSISAYGGDPAVLTTVTAASARLRQLSAADQTALYEDGSGNIIGILGLFQGNVGTDANGVINQVLAPVSVNAAVVPIYPLTGIDGVNNGDSISGRGNASILLFGDENLIGGYLWENTTALVSTLIDQPVGIKISTISSVKYYFWSTAAAVKIGIISRVNVNDPMYNKTAVANVADTTHSPRCPIAVTVIPAYCQNQTAFNYAT